jgi:hypothetical protein
MHFGLGDDDISPSHDAMMTMATEAKQPTKQQQHSFIVESRRHKVNCCSE